MNLTDLPPEVLLLIFLNLKTKFVLSSVTCVCKLFYHIITPKATWKTRFGKIWPKRSTNCDLNGIIPRLVQFSFLIQYKYIVHLRCVCYDWCQKRRADLW